MADQSEGAFSGLPISYFVRHGQTPWNAENRLQGQSDIDISPVGRAQADANGLSLRSLISDPALFDFVASPMRRTRETMERLRVAMDLDPQAYRTDKRLVELNFGEWQGFSYAELEARDPGITAERMADKWRFVPPGKGAESYAMLLTRVAPVLREITRPTVCVTHGGVIRTIFVLAGAMTPEEAAVTDTPQDRILRLERGRLEWI